MSEVKFGKLFKNGRSQAVRLPAEFRMPGDRVRVSRVGDGVLLEPVRDDLEKMFADIDRLVQGRFMEDGREQPPMPPDDPLDSFD